MTSTLPSHWLPQNPLAWILHLYIPLVTTSNQKGDASHANRPTNRLPRSQRANWEHRDATRARLIELEFKPDDVLPPDFHRRHWRDQQRYFESILGLRFCVRC